MAPVAKAAGKALFCVCVLSDLTFGVSGQSRPAQPQNAPTFRATTEYVVLDVVVTDAADRPVTDLTQADFQVSERGRTQRITDFSFVDVPVVRREIDLDAVPLPPSDIAANGVSPKQGRALAVVVDDTALRAEDIIPIKRTLRELSSALSPDDQVALTYVRRSDLGHDFTSDSGRLIGAINNLRAAVGNPADVRDLLVVLDNVVRTLSGAHHGRKAVVLIGTRGCIPLMQDRESAPNCDDVIERATKAGVPIYAADPRGLVDAETVFGIAAINDEVDRANLTGVIAAGSDSMKTLASATGGRAFVQSDLKRAIRDLMTENGSYYLLGYYPQPFDRDGKFHEVDIAVTRPGVRVRARRGYTAPGASEQLLTPHRAMTTSLGAGLPDPSLPIRAFVAPMAAADKGVRSVVTIEVTYPEPESGFKTGFDDELQIGILALDADARIKASFQRPMTFKGAWKPGAIGKFVIDEVVDLPSQALTVRVGVMSRALNKTGTAHIPIKVPDLREAELTLTPIVIGLADESPDVVIGLDLLRPLVPFQPSLARVFSTDQSLRVFARARWKSERDAIEGSITLMGTSSFTPQRFTISGAVLKSRQREATVDRRVSFAGVQSGRYVLRLEVQSTTSDRTHREVPIEVK